MRIAGGKREKGVTVGNVYDKYNTKNPIAKRIMRGFRDALDGLVRKVAPNTLHEVGCGEGYWTLLWREAGITARGSDFSTEVIKLAKLNAVDKEYPPEIFQVRSVYDLVPEEDTAELIVCCEVLEHLEDPEAALKALDRVSSRYVILSVPREPIWRVLNMARGKYLRDLGNTPGHVQHWSCSTFVALVRNHFEIMEVRNPLPWTMVLARNRES